MTMVVLAELAPKGNRIMLTSEYDPKVNDAIKTIPGHRFVDFRKGGPYWTVARDINTCRRLREIFGSSLHIGPFLLSWARQEKAAESVFLDLGIARDAVLEHLPSQLPKLHKILRGYQRAGIKFGAVSQHPLFADPPRLGKTFQSIGTVFEAQTDAGPNLVMAPISTLETVWWDTLTNWQPHQVFLATGDKHKRLATIENFLFAVEGCGEPAWLIINPAMVTYRSKFDVCDNHLLDEPVSILRQCEYCEEYKVCEYDDLQHIRWNNIIVDECSRNGIRNPKTQTGEALNDLQLAPGGKRQALTGTPMGGKALNLWGILHWLRPDIFTSKWQWAGMWLKVEDNGYGKQIDNEINSDHEKAFYRSLVPFMIRREKEDVRPELPKREPPVDVWCEMTPKQNKQYQVFAADAEIKIENNLLTATSILAEYARLKQFANARQNLVDGKLIALPDSGKLSALEDILDERGMLFDSDEQIVIFSQFRSVAEMIYAWLEKLQIKARQFTGSTSQIERAQIQRDFQASRVKAIVMTTTSGGLGITLDRADTCVFLDETWDPDDQEQAWNRIDPVTHLNMKSTYFLRSKGTIEEYIQGVNIDKNHLNMKVLMGIKLR